MNDYGFGSWLPDWPYAPPAAQPFVWNTITTDSWHEYGEAVRRLEEQFAKTARTMGSALATITTQPTAQPESGPMKLPKGAARKILPPEVARDPTFKALLRTCQDNQDFGPFLVTADYVEERGLGQLARAFRWCAKNKRRPYRAPAPFHWRWLSEIAVFMALPDTEAGAKMARLPESIFARFQNASLIIDMHSFGRGIVGLAWALAELIKMVEA